jgi:hypothetical protein
MSSSDFVQSLNAWADDLRCRNGSPDYLSRIGVVFRTAPESQLNCLRPENRRFIEQYRQNGGEITRSQYYGNSPEIGWPITNRPGQEGG